jgi:hypothetical protein
MRAARRRIRQRWRRGGAKFSRDLRGACQQRPPAVVEVPPPVVWMPRPPLPYGYGQTLSETVRSVGDIPFRMRAPQVAPPGVPRSRVRFRRLLCRRDWPGCTADASLAKPACIDAPAFPPSPHRLSRGKTAWKRRTSRKPARGQGGEALLLAAWQDPLKKAQLYHITRRVLIGARNARSL